MDVFILIQTFLLLVGFRIGKIYIKKMDRIYNNEFLAACIVIAILKTGITDITLLTVCLTLVMEENKNLEMESIQENEEKSSFDFATIYTVLILNC